MGKFYELFDGDADLGVKHLQLAYMKNSKVRAILCVWVWCLIGVVLLRVIWSRVCGAQSFCYTCCLSSRLLTLCVLVARVCGSSN